MRPWAVKEDILRVMSEIITRHIQGEKLSQDEIAARTSGKRVDTPDYEVRGDVAIVPVTGVIAKHSSMVNGVSQPQGTSIGQIKSNFQAAMNDDKVSTIALLVDSPGGSVDGVSEMADEIFAARGKKKIYAFADGQMDSAAYWIGSAAEKIYASRSSEVGSIGVYAIMSDYSVALHNEGVRTTVLKAGKFKAAGNPYKPATEDEIKVLQSEIDEYYGLFTSAVGRNRAMSAEQVMEVADGRVHIGQKAEAAGLVDGIMSIDEFLKTRAAHSAAGSPDRARASEDGQTITAEAVEAAPVEAKKEQTMEPIKLESITLDQLRAARPDLAALLVAEGKDAEKANAGQSVSQAVDAERARSTQIFEKAKAMNGVDAVAVECVKTGMTVEAAESKLKAAKLDLIQKSTEASKGGENNVETQSMKGLDDTSIEQECEKVWSQNPAVRAEFGQDKKAYIAFAKADAKGLVKILGRDKIQK